MQYSKAIVLLALGITAVSSNAAKRADLNVTMQSPSQVETGEMFQVFVVANNSGQRRARNVAVDIEVPPNIAIVGHADACSTTGSGLSCVLGNLNSNASHTLQLTLAAPLSEGSVSLNAVGSTTSREHTTNNNSAAVTVVIADPIPPTFPISTQTDLQVSICVSLSGPLTWSQCTPGSLLTQTLTLNADNSVTTYDPGVTGSWTQTDPGVIQMDFVSALDQSPMLTLSGDATSPSCFEGTAAYHQSTAWGAWQGCTP